MISKRGLATAAAIGAAGALFTAPATAAGRPGVIDAVEIVPLTVPAAPATGTVRVARLAACDPVTGTALINVTYTGATPAEVLLTVRFATGVPGPRLGDHRFTGAGQHAFHVEWLPGGKYDVYLNTEPPADPAATVATPHLTCTVHPTGTADAVHASADVGPAGADGSGGTLAHTGAADDGAIAAVGTLLLLGGGTLLLTRRRRAPRR